MKSLNILIVGGGIGGPVAAYWLARAGHQVTIVEKLPVLRAGGSQIDIRHQGVEVIRKMGLYDKIREVSVLEAGTALVDGNNKTKVWLPADGEDNKGTSLFTQEIEIMRGDLVRVLHAEIKQSVIYVFGKSVEHFEQDSESVTVTFSDSTTPHKYDLLIGADGLGSQTRRAMLGSKADECFKPLNLYVGFWFIPRGPSDTNVARFNYLPGRKVLLLRSTRDTETQAGCMIKSDDLGGLRKLPEAQQKEFWASTMRGLGWETDRMIAGLEGTTDFYCTELAQIKAPTWSKGRVVLLGDAAFCPSPMTGMGTTSAVVGAYVLAGEIASHPDDLGTALENYEKVYRPFVREAQDLIPPMDIFLPETTWGIAFVQYFVTVVYWLLLAKAWLKLDTIWERLFPDRLKAWRLPVYSALA